MIRSMTGFARRERQFPWGLLAWELKTVNHRFLEIGVRLPEEFRVGEAEFRQSIAASVRRGPPRCPGIAALARRDSGRDPRPRSDARRRARPARRRAGGARALSRQR